LPPSGRTFAVDGNNYEFKGYMVNKIWVMFGNSILVLLFSMYTVVQCAK